MKTTFVCTTAIALLLPAPASAVDTIPAQFVGQWCHSSELEVYVDKTHTQNIGSVYDPVKKGARKGCKIAEDELIVQPTSLFIAGEVTCKPTKIIPVSPRQYKVTADCTDIHRDPSTLRSYFSIKTGKGRKALVLSDVNEDEKPIESEGTTEQKNEKKN